VSLPTAAQAEAADRRSRVRRRLAAAQLVVAWDRADLSAPTNPQTAAVAGCSQAATIQAAWIVERTIAWLQNIRRLVARYERYPQMCLAFIRVA